MPEENDQMVTEPEFGDAELEQWLTSVGDGAEITLPGLDIGVPVSSRKPGDQLHTGEQGQQGGAGDEEPDDDDDDEEVDDGTPTGTPAVPVATQQDTFLINGQEFAREDIERLYNFDQYMRSNPDVAQRVNDAIKTTTPGQPPVSETTTPASTTADEWKDPEPPDFLDLEDPAQKFQWDTHVATQKVLHDQEQRQRAFFAQQAQTQQQQTVRQAQQDMATALDSFKQVHPNLNDDDIAKIRLAAGPFVDGMMKQLPPVEALTRAMEVGGMMDEDLRTKLTDTSVRTRSEKQQSRHRKARLGELSGSGRSAPKTDSRPVAFSSDKDFLNALAAGFSEAIQR